MIHRWRLRQPQVHLHFTPTGASWLNLIERSPAEQILQDVARLCTPSLHHDNGGLSTAVSATLDTRPDLHYFICVSNRGRADVLQGTLDVMILQTLATLGPSHGYALAARIEQVSSGLVQLNMGTLYPGLMRLEQRGFLRGAWGVTDTNRKARFYSLTPAGRRQLDVEKREWARMVAIMHAMLSEPT